MMIILGILGLGLLPVALTPWVLRGARREPALARPRRPKRGMGDPTCRFNARSRYLRCAVNPAGPCLNCVHREPITQR